MFRKIVAVSSVALALAAGTASAATVSVTYKAFGRGTLDTALAERDAFIGANVLAAEDFEIGFIGCNAVNKKVCSSEPIGSVVGTFTGYGAAHVGGDSQIKPKDRIVVRGLVKNSYGRYNVTPGGMNWLDSNDREGIAWSYVAEAGKTFQRLAFLLTDIDDVGDVLFGISVNGETAVMQPDPKKTRNSRLHLITMLFDQPASMFEMVMINGAGDGFGLDGVRLGSIAPVSPLASVAPVPVPAAGLLLAGALGGIAGLARRRRKAA